MNTAALVLGFNRPELLRRNLKANAASGIGTVFIHLDGARNTNLYESSQVEKCMEVVEESRGLYSHVETFYSKTNLGCRFGVREGLDWFFSLNRNGLIIEDDILISKNFVEFSTYMLSENHKNNIWAINGWSPFNANEITSNPFLTRYFLPWGWATWSDKWSEYLEEVDWIAGSKARNLATNLNEGLPIEFDDYWNEIFSNREVMKSTWDYQWQYSMWRNGGFCVSPPYRLTKNIGFDKDATHTLSTGFRSDLGIRHKALNYRGDIKAEMLIDQYHGKLLYNISDKSDLKSASFFQRYRINKLKSYSVTRSFFRSIFYPGITSVYLTPNKIKLFCIKLFPYLKKLSKI
jgi:GR25 family glycosyltransferase involved in LPS biosynthesis